MSGKRLSLRNQVAILRSGYNQIDVMKTKRNLILILILMSIALTVSIGANVILFQRGEQYYRQLNAVRLDPIGLNIYQEMVQPEADLPLVVFYGDSRAASWPQPTIEDFEFINRGIGAQTSAQILGRFEQHVMPLEPDVLVLQVGINDLKTIPLFPDRRESIVENLIEHIRDIIEHSNRIGADVIVTTIFPQGRIPLERRPFWSDDVQMAIHEVNDFIRTLPSQNVILLDAYHILADENGHTHSEYVLDFLHINHAGYQHLNHSLVSILNEWNK
jgi:lysophospholipase L1-like esterase